MALSLRGSRADEPTQMHQTHDAALEQLSQQMADEVRPLIRTAAGLLYEAWTKRNVDAHETQAQASFFRAVADEDDGGVLTDRATAWAVEWEARGFLAGFHAAQQLLNGR